MEQPKRHPMEMLLLYIAHKLRDQYADADTLTQFDIVIHAAEESAAKEATETEEHEQGKLPPTVSLPETDKIPTPRKRP